MYKMYKAIAEKLPVILGWFMTLAGITVWVHMVLTYIYAKVS